MYIGGAVVSDRLSKSSTYLSHRREILTFSQQHGTDPHYPDVMQEGVLQQPTRYNGRYQMDSTVMPILNIY